jgi:hypothetical protein
MGLVRSASAPPASALRFVSASPYAVIMMIGTSGRAALALGNSSSPLIPGMLMSERIRMSERSPASVMRWSAAGADWANSMVSPGRRLSTQCDIGKSHARAYWLINAAS